MACQIRGICINQMKLKVYSYCASTSSFYSSQSFFNVLEFQENKEIKRKRSEEVEGIEEEPKSKSLKGRKILT